MSNFRYEYWRARRGRLVGDLRPDRRIVSEQPRRNGLVGDHGLSDVCAVAPVAKATVTGKQQADVALQKFYRDVLPVNASAAAMKAATSRS